MASPMMATALTWLGTAFMAAGLALVLSAFLAATRAWRNGVPWWSGGMIWFNTALQPPQARPHIRAVWRRFGLGAAVSLVGSVLLTALEGAPR